MITSSQEDLSILQKPPPTLLDLPDEIKYLIFKSLPTTSQSKLATTCKSLRDIYVKHQPLLLKNLYFISQTFTTEFINAVVAKTSSATVESLVLVKCIFSQATYERDIDIIITTHHKTLDKIKIEASQVSNRINGFKHSDIPENMIDYIVSVEDEWNIGQRNNLYSTLMSLRRLAQLIAVF